MRQKVLKFQAKVPGQKIDLVTINMPRNAVPLKVSIAPRGVDIMNVHALVREGTGGQHDPATFLIIGTGVELPEDAHWRYIDTLIDGGYYWHVFLKVEKVVGL